ncbi:isoleucine--tRNA ligase [Bacteroidales bacterium OttesenSCG-928-A17]|nr:isoleucine--tRNA ligase [Bacteroidales bacterium OttesenSCG-928-A17]
MNKKFAEYDKLNLSDINQEVLDRWEKNNVFHKSLEIRKDAPAFIFYEGPPSANGMPGIHHVIARSIKDIFCRYKTMKGFLVNRKAGWDTHGLPVELSVEKALGITKEDIGKKISVEEYNEACRKDVMKYTKEWEDLTHKMGYWVDMNDPYITYDNRYIETLWWLLKELYKKDLLYKGYTIQPYSPAAGTGLSTHELNQPGCYRDVKDTTCTAQFKIQNPLPHMANFGEAFFLAWTTTPWTLPSNTALCVGPNIDYVAVQTYNPYSGKPSTVVLAKDLVGSYFNPKAAELDLGSYNPGDKLIPWQIVASWKGAELVGLEYEQLIPWVNPGKGAFRVIPGDYVTTEDGTGIVHIAPTFGADDARVGKQNGIPPLMMIDKDGNQRPMVDQTGKFYALNDLDADFLKEYVNVALYAEYAGRFVKNAYDPKLTEEDATLDVDLCVMLKQHNRAFRIEKHTHNYPHCWRTDKPVLYYPLDSWFIRTTALRERMIELNQTINWKPASTGTGRFGKWLENLQDWNLSRSRYWGTPLPIWRTEDGSEEKCIGSVEELINEINKSVEKGFMDKNPFPNMKPGDYSAENYATDKIDLHRPFVDRIVLVSDSGKPMKRESDLIDVWFDSGAMPYAQIHYPFENKELFDSGKVFPADFIAEGVDQTRGWFFTLHAIATMIFDNVSFKAVISNGLVLDKNGNKMSKRLGNGVDPFQAISVYGSDSLRWYMITNASPWDNLKFDPEGVEEVRRKFFGTLYNTYSFFALYANVDGFDYSEPDVPFEERPEIDRWILSLLNTLVKEVDENLEAYEPTRAGRAINDFVNDNLSNWYVRLNRKRFWGGKMDQDKLSAYQTLYTCLETVAKLMAPIAPFYADKLYLDLINATGCHSGLDPQSPATVSESRIKSEMTNISVHLVDFPVVNEKLIDKALEERMDIAQKISSMVLALRRKVNIKVRQPLSRIMVPVLDNHQKEAVEAVSDLVLNEVNVKALEYVDGTAGILVKKIKPDFKKLGPRYGKIMKDLAVAISGMSQDAINELEKNAVYQMQVADQTVEITADDVEIISEDIPGWLVANEGKLTVALDITLTDELKREGIARELVNRIQNIRKSKGFEITDKITVQIQSDDRINDAVGEYKTYIANQILAESIELTGLTDGIELDMDDYRLFVKVDKK